VVAHLRAILLAVLAKLGFGNNNGSGVAHI